MTKQILCWKRVICQNVQNQDYESSLPEVISTFYEGKLLAKILMMPPKTPIPFNEAIRIVCATRLGTLKKMSAAEYSWFYENFVQFISDSGFHIEITGDEFIFHLSRDLEC